MRKVLFIGGDRLARLRDGLTDDGYDALSRPPGDTGERDDFAPDVIVLELGAAAEDPAVKRFLGEPQSSEGPAVIAIVDPEGSLEFEPALGFDDFLASTATPRELSLRIRQALWRRTGVDAQNVLRCSELEMDLANYTVRIAGRSVELTYKEYELLRFLATNPDRVFNRDVLLNKVWGYDFYGGARTVDVHIRRLRSKIEDRHHTFIETVRNVGYRFRAGPSSPHHPEQ